MLRVERKYQRLNTSSQDLRLQSKNALCSSTVQSNSDTWLLNA
jgi:hypothetical protein